jgi:DNA-binding CsgD family transcriptional regulator
MRNNKLKPPSFPLEFYPDELLVIKNIKFTPRHIDIMACLISGGTGKTISSLLSIEIKTIEAHKKDIAGRLGGGIQENIIAFIQSSDKYGLIKQHYLRLLKKVEFEKLLKELTKGIKKNLPHCIIEPKTAYQTQGKNKSTFINLLTYHLNLAGIKILEKSDQPGQYLDNKNTGAQLLYFIDEHLIDRLKSAPMSQKIILILQNPTLKEEFLKISHHINSIDFTDPSSYFRSFIELLERVTPSHDFTSLKAIMDGKELNSKNFNQNTAFKDLRADIGGIPFSLLPNILYSKKHKAIGIAFLIMSLLSLGFWIHTETGVETNNKISLASIHSDLVIPSEASLLNRQDLMAEIASQLKGDQGIQTVALVGMGGAGKNNAFTRLRSQATIPRRLGD